MNGNPATQLVTQTQNGIALRNVQSNWQNYSTFYGGDDDGMSTGTFDPDFPVNVVRSYWLNYARAFSGSNYNLIASNLDSNSTYTLKFIASVKSTVNNTVVTDYHVLTNNVDQKQTLNCVNNTENIISFTGVVPDENGEIKIGIFQKQDGTGGQFGVISGLIISKN